MEAYLGRDQGGKGAALDEAHLDGWGSISINCTGFEGRLGCGARTWAGKTMGLRVEVDGDGCRDESCEFLRAGSSAWRISPASFNNDITTADDDQHPQPPPCLLSTGQLALACLRPPCAQPRRAPSPPYTAHTRPTRTFPTSTRQPLRMRPPCPSRATPLRSGRRMPPRE